MTVTFLSCKKDENKDYFVGGTAPALTASVATTIPLSFANKDNEGVKLMWTNPAYMFSTGVSSQDVSYLIEIDTAGASFTNPHKQSIVISKDLSVSITQGTFNDYLLNQLVLLPSMVHHIEIRVTSTLANSKVPLVSNVLKFDVTPYPIPPKVAPPVSGHLYLVGSATAGGWNNPVPIPTQEFTKISTTLYRITINLIGGQQYLFLPVNGDWSHKYACVAANTVSSGGDFGYDFNDNFPGPGTGGTYTIEVDFQRGKFTVQ
jgi:hypothetical protein